jgi:hypothetical protein
MPPLARTTLALAALSLLALQTARGATIKFAGVEIEGAKNVAFVCDGSRWMKNKIEDLQIELAAAVDTLAADQQVSIVFFADDKPYGPNDGRPLPATDENKKKLKDWLSHVELGDAPTPMPGITRAFEGKPDTVIFVTEGQFENFDEIESHVAKLNAAKAAKVYPVGFFRSEKEDDSATFARFMKKLAEDYGGKFHAVYVDELKRAR